LAHYSCCTGWGGGPSSKEPLAAAVVEALEAAADRATGAEEGPEGWKRAARGNGFGQDSAPGPTGGESRGAVDAGVDADAGADVGCGGARQA
jgi:hypothetical protein